MSASALLVLLVCVTLTSAHANHLEWRPPNYAPKPKVYGLRLLCEGKRPNNAGTYIGPTSKLFTSHQKLIARGTSDCKLRRIHGMPFDEPRWKENNDRKYLWSVKGPGRNEEFSELNAAFEYQLSCIYGQVHVINTVTNQVLYKVSTELSDSDIVALL